MPAQGVKELGAQEALERLRVEGRGQGDTVPDPPLDAVQRRQRLPRLPPLPQDLRSDAGCEIRCHRSALRRGRQLLEGRPVRARPLVFAQTHVDEAEQVLPEHRVEVVVRAVEDAGVPAAGHRCRIQRFQPPPQVVQPAPIDGHEGESGEERLVLQRCRRVERGQLLELVPRRLPVTFGQENVSEPGMARGTNLHRAGWFRHQARQPDRAFDVVRPRGHVPGRQCQGHVGGPLQPLEHRLDLLPPRLDGRLQSQHLQLAIALLDELVVPLDQ